MPKITTIYTGYPTPTKDELRIMEFLDRYGVPYKATPVSQMSREDIQELFSNSYDGIEDFLKSTFRYNEDWSMSQLMDHIMTRRTKAFKTPITITPENRILRGNDESEFTTLLPRALRKAMLSEAVTATAGGYSEEELQQLTGELAGQLEELDQSEGESNERTRA